MYSVSIVCSGRNIAKPSLWRGRQLTREATLAVQRLKRAAPAKDAVKGVLRSQVSRLIKIDMLQVVNELQRQNEAALAFEVFKLVRKETWYVPDTVFYLNMMDALAKKCMLDELRMLRTEFFDKDQALLQEDCIQQISSALERVLNVS